MASSGILKTILLLRILCLLVLAASVVVMGLNNFTEDDGSNDKVKFTDLIAYRYVFAAGCIGFVYTLIQVPFAMYNVIKQKRLNGYLQQVDFYGDKIMAFLLASGAGVGFGVIFELKRTFGDFFDKQVDKYFDMGKISTGLLLVGFVFMAVLCVFSSLRHPKQRMFK